MSRPRKGVGEHRLLKKGPLLFTTALLSFYPVCMAEAATSSFEKSPLFASSGLYAHLAPHLTTSTLLDRPKNQPKSYLNPRSLSSVPLSIETLDNLKSTLSNYQNQLNTLKNSTPKDPQNASSYASTITDVENKIQTLKQRISALESALKSTEKAKNTLSEALIRLQDTQTALSNATTQKTDAIIASNTAKSNLDVAEVTLSTSTQIKNEADAALTQQKSVTSQSLETLNARQTQTITSAENLAQAQQTFNEAEQQLQLAQNQLSTATSNKTQAQAELDAASSKVQTKQQEVDAARKTHNQAVLDYNEALNIYTTVYNEYLDAEATLNNTRANLNEAQTQLDQAQYNYDTYLIQDPTWTAPTQQVAHTRTVPHTETVYTTTLVPHTTTTLQEQVIPNLLPNSTLTNTDGWSGVYAGWQGSQPGMYDGEITFSYTNQTVSQGLYSGPFQNATLTLSADWYSDWTSDSYSMTVTAEDINRNPVGTATYTNTRTGHDWTNRSVTLEATGPVSYITVSFSGIDHGFWYGMYGPRMKNPTLKVSYGEYVTETTYEEVITSEEVTTYVEETYYTTEVIQPQQGLTVRVYNNLPTSNPQRSDTAYNLCKTTTLTKIENNWGGGDILGCGDDRVLIHYTGYITPTENITYLMNQADDGFYMDLNGSNVINNWTLKGCGGNWNSVNLQAGRSYAIDAWFFEWGGGACSTLYYQTSTGSGVVPASWYSNGASAPMIHDPALLSELQRAQVYYDATLLANQQAEEDYQLAQASQQEAAQNSTSGYYQVIDTAASLNSLSAELDVDQNTLNQAQSAYSQAELDLQTTQTQTDNARTIKSSAQETLNEASVNLSTANSQLQAAEQDYNIQALKSQAAQTSYEEASLEVETNNTILLNYSQTYNNSLNDLSTATSAETQASSDATEAAINKEEIENNLSTIETSNETSLNLAAEESSEVQASIDAANEILNQPPAPLPEPEPEGSTEIPAVIENLMDVDLNAVDPTELTEAQAEQLVEAALETFETATEGSPEYEQALDALYLAAEQDDIELSPELAAIPGLAGAVEVLNFLGNAGADMSPKVREESEKVVVTAVVATGAAIQAAAGAAASAATGASAPSGGGSRRVGK